MEVPSALDQADVDLEGLEESKGFTPGRAKTPRTELPKGLKTLSSLVDVDSEMSHAAAIGHVSFHRVGYEVPIKVDKGVDTKMVLDGVSGEVLPGEMLAVMGPSGSGKTSLLHVLAMRVNPEHMSGEIRVNGARPKKAFKRFTGFVFQDDLMFDNLTVRETIFYSARLRLPESLGKAGCMERTDFLLALLKLEGCANTKIGGFARRGVSGGERKRTAIGVELITTPKILFLDEPTSGLDASTALTLCTLLKDLAKRRMMLVSSIHQPRENIFNQFDKVLLLWQGRTVYYGPTSRVVDYFERAGYTVPLYTNVADWLLDITTVENSQGQQLGGKLASAFESSTPPYAQIAAYMGAGSPTAMPQPLEEASRWRSSFFHQFLVLLERSNKQQSGDVFNKVSVLQTLVVAAVVSALWFQSNSVDDLQGMLFFIIIQQCFNVLNAVVRIFPAERNIVLRERSTGSYRVGAYFLSKTCSDLYVTYLLPTVFGTSVYWCAGLRADPLWAFPAFIATFLSAIMAAHALGLLISAAIPDIAVATSVSFVLTLQLMLFAGFYVQNYRIPVGIDWLKYLSFPYWAYRNFVVIEWRDNYVPCSFARKGEYGPNCPIDGNVIVEGRGFSNHEVWLGFVMLWVFVIGYRIAAYLCLRFLNRLKA